MARSTKQLLILLALLLAPLCSAAKKLPPSPEELTNFQLSPAYSRWLIGPIYYLASDDEVQKYLALSDDDAARSFIAAFWQRRDSNGPAPGNPLHETFKERLERADVLFDRPPVPGHQTDRGVIYVLYGPPDKTEIESATEVGAPPLEVWSYPDRPVGLDGKRARPKIEFILAPDGSARLTRRPD